MCLPSGFKLEQKVTLVFMFGSKVTFMLYIILYYLLISLMHYLYDLYYSKEGSL